MHAHYDQLHCGVVEYKDWGPQVCGVDAKRALQSRTAPSNFCSFGKERTVQVAIMEVGRISVEKEVSFEHLEATAEAHNAIPEILRHYTPGELVALERKLVRKIDFRALPILIVLFLLNVLDRNAIANARLGGLEASLGIDDVQYQTAVMVLWAGYISMMIPSNMLLSIFKPRLYLPTVVIIWGIVSGATGFVQNHAGLVALRFLVGVTEAPYFPGCKFIPSTVRQA
jgi:hypothetical protein